jgi:ERCC4-related helicase
MIEQREDFSKFYRPKSKYSFISPFNFISKLQKIVGHASRKAEGMTSVNQAQVLKDFEKEKI